MNKLRSYFIISIITIIIITFIIISLNNTFSQTDKNQKIIYDDIDEKYLKAILKENDKITLLSEYKDKKEQIIIKLKNLSLINKVRKTYKLQELSFDILASRIANKHCKEMIEKDYFSHWNTEGYKPYHRYSLIAKGYDHISENLSSYWTSGEIENTEERILELMALGLSQFMSEKPPNDGHKQQVINPLHNYVGIGYANDRHSFRYAQEFIDRYVIMNDFSQNIKVNDKIILSGSMINDDKEVYGLIGFYEDFPKPLTIDQLNSKGACPDFTDEKAFLVPPWDIIYSDDKKNFSIELDFKNKKKGLYYIQLLVRNKTKGRAKGKVSFSTQDSATSIVISVR